MTTVDVLKRECAEVASRGREFIHPYRMKDIMNAAYKATDAIYKVLGLTNYREVEATLRIMLEAVAEASGKIEEEG